MIKLFYQTSLNNSNLSLNNYINNYIVSFKDTIATVYSIVIWRLELKFIEKTRIFL